MSGEFTVSPESFSPVAGQLRQVSDQLQSSWAPVRSQSQSVHFGRGDDMVSPLIQVSLQGAIALVDSCITSSAKSLHGYADGLESMGKTYADAEQNNTALMTAKKL
jgi:hypothetical protein